VVGRRSGLGKRLSAIIPPEDISGTPSALRDLLVTQIEPSRFQPRARFDEDSLVALTASIRELGVLQPVLVRPLDEDTFELIAGERRWRAAKRAGLQTIPALVREAGDTDSLEQALVENLHREDLNPLEEAGAYQQLIEDFGLTHDQVAQRVGRSRSAISNVLRLFQLPPSIQKLVADGQLSAGHARALLGTPDRAYQEGLARRAVAEGLSVRDVETAVRARQEPASSGPTSPGLPPPGRLRPPGLLELESLLASHLETRVRVTMGGNRGRVIIDFATLDDLERLYRLMTEPGAEPGSTLDITAGAVGEAPLQGQP
jgi:ParB family chromosome partitioning protein